MQELTFQQIVVIAAGIGTLLALGTTIWNIFSSGARAAAKRLDAMDLRVAVVERQSDRLGEQLGGVPNTDQLHRLELEMAKLGGRLDVLSERLQPVEAISERMQELLIQGRAK